MMRLGIPLVTASKACVPVSIISVRCKIIFAWIHVHQYKFHGAEKLKRIAQFILISHQPTTPVHNYL